MFLDTSGFLPASRAELAARGWDWVDVVLVTGDAYVDHPAFGVALIGRWLEAHGYRVAILAQPPGRDPAAFRQFGPPRLFFGITAGNLDSIVANYSGNAKVRDKDDFSPGGNPYFGESRQKAERRRPDRATIRYANLARAACPGVPIVLGGLEASLRRLVHFDYQQEKMRTSVLTDAKADLLVFGMGERAVVEIAARLAAGLPLPDIPGTCERLTDRQKRERKWPRPPAVLPGWPEIASARRHFLEAELAVDRQARSGEAVPLLQQQRTGWVLQHPAAPPLTTPELDRLYLLPFQRKPHPAAGEVPAYRMIRHSVTIVRGCSGNCSFCAISRHQGPVVTSRSQASILAEVERITKMEDFRGTISDLGGPTANLYATGCSRSKCSRHDCLFPGVCPHFRIDEGSALELLRQVAAHPLVKHVYVSSGLRMEILLRTPRLLEQILCRHTPGALKIAPEHTDPQLLRRMHKPGPEILEQFLTACREIGRRRGVPCHFNGYFIASHPGCTTREMEALGRRLRELDLPVRQFQDFTPTPGTLSTAMYVSGLDRDTLQAIPVARGGSERRAQRLVLERLGDRIRPRDEGRRKKRRGSAHQRFRRKGS